MEVPSPSAGMVKELQRQGRRQGVQGLARADARVRGRKCRGVRSASASRARKLRRRQRRSGAQPRQQQHPRRSLPPPKPELRHRRRPANLRRSGARAFARADRRRSVRQGARKPFGAPPRARARRRSLEGEGHAGRRIASSRKTCRTSSSCARRGRAPLKPRLRRRSRAAAAAAGGFLEVRPDQDAAAVAHQEDLGRGARTATG